MSDPIEVECGHCEGSGKYEVEPSRHVLSGCYSGRHEWCVERLVQRESGVIIGITVCCCECGHGRKGGQIEPQA